MGAKRSNRGSIAQPPSKVKKEKKKGEREEIKKKNERRRSGPLVEALRHRLPQSARNGPYGQKPSLKALHVLFAKASTTHAVSPPHNSSGPFPTRLLSTYSKRRVMMPDLTVGMPISSFFDVLHKSSQILKIVPLFQQNHAMLF
jgi:hypothetical protein